MQQPIIYDLPWADPIDYASALPENNNSWALLLSSMQVDFTGRYSFLAMKPKQTITDNNFASLEAALSSDQGRFTNSWFGYLGYGLRHDLEDLPKDTASYLSLPDMWMTQYCIVLVFDHEKQSILAYVESESDATLIPAPSISSTLKQTVDLDRLHSNMTKADYLAKVATVKEAIYRGDLYQANVTRKFYGTFSETPSPLACFAALVAISPAPYSALLKCGDSYILSSSPEQFLTIDEKGQAETRPIKGSAPREGDLEADRKTRENLQKSEKDRAENLMIVDLMRNDLSRHCQPGSVKVDKLFDITSYATIHHMASTIRGTKQEHSAPIELVKGCFPPGSMTGAPKIKAMELCSALESQERGVYSGAIGWFGGDGSLDLSVVIRTIIMQGNRFEFQVGGAIVADSNPEDEWLETLAKARGVAAALNIPISKLAAL